MIFRGDGYIDAGGRFADIEAKVEVSAKNYVSTVTDAIKKSITSHVATDEYIEQKKKQEQKEKEEFYQANKEKLMKDDFDMTDMVSEADKCDELKAQIKAAIAPADNAKRKELQEKIKSAGLPIQYQKVNDASILEQILTLVTE